jgi:hypothetical protein
MGFLGDAEGETLILPLILLHFPPPPMSEEEGPNTQHEVEGAEGRRRGEHYKG